MLISRVARMVLCAVLLVGLVTFAPPVPTAHGNGTPWLWRNPFPSGESLWDTEFLTADVGYAAGGFGTLMKTADGGVTWRYLPSGTTQNLYAIDLVDSDTGWAGGNGGTLLKTIDGGETWVPQVVPDGSTYHIYDVWMHSSTSGVALTSEGRVIATTNGTDWTLIADRDEEIVALDFIDGLTGWAVGNSGTILKTTDGGATWTPQTSNVTEHLKGVDFVDAMHGWAVGQGGKALRTTDGGANWVPQSLGNPSYTYFWDVAFVDAHKGWAVADMFGQGKVWVTTNGGETWTDTGVWHPRAGYALQVLDATTARAVGKDGVVLATDNGTTWTDPRTTVAWEGLRDAQFLDDSTGWVVGTGGMAYRTTDGGTTWTGLLLAADKSSLHAVHFPDADHGWIVDNNAHVYVTSNGGDDWTLQESGVDAYLTSVWFADATTGWAVGHPSSTSGGLPTILATTDGGLTWTPQTSPVAGALNDVQFASSTLGWAVGVNGLVLTTTDGGANWVQQTSPAIGTTTLEGVEVIDASTLWAFGWGRKLVVSSNGGTDWAPATLPPSLPGSLIYDVKFADADTGWAVGDGGLTLATSDGGETWVPQQFSTATWRGLSVIDATKAWMVGDGGAMAATQDAAPFVGTFMVNNNAEYANSTEVQLHSGVPLATTMRYRTSKDGGTSWSAWSDSLPYESIKPVTVSHGDGERLFEAEYSDSVRTLTLQDSIVIDTVVPTAPAVSATPLTASSVRILWSGAVDDGSGIGGYEVYLGDLLLGTVGGSTTEYTTSGLAQNTSYTFAVRAVDGAGNVSVAGEALATTHRLYPVYRFFRPSSGTHFYTPNEAEKASVMANLSHIYTYEGIAYLVNPLNNSQPLHRFYNKRNGSHFYTASEAEKASVIKNLSAIYSYDGPTYKVSTAAATGKPPVYRFYNKRNGSHFYTANESEKASVIDNLSGTYTYEGTAFWLGQ